MIHSWDADRARGGSGGAQCAQWGGDRAGLKAAAAAFQRETGHAVRITFNTTPQIRQRIAGGDASDVVIAPPAAIEEFAKAGRLETDRVLVGRVGLGAAVRPGAPVPDIFQRGCAQASGAGGGIDRVQPASTGLYFEELLKKMGVYDQVASRTTRYPDGASVMEHVLIKGQGREIGFGPITEILLYKTKGCGWSGRCPPRCRTTRPTLRCRWWAVEPRSARAFVAIWGAPPARRFPGGRHRVAGLVRDAGRVPPDGPGD